MSNFELLKERILEKESKVSTRLSNINTNRTKNVITRISDNTVVSTASTSFSGTGLGSIITINNLTAGKPYELTSIVGLSFVGGALGQCEGMRLLEVSGAPVILKSHGVINKTSFERVTTITDIFRIVPLSNSLQLRLDLRLRNAVGSIQKDTWEVIIR